MNRVVVVWSRQIFKFKINQPWCVQELTTHTTLLLITKRCYISLRKNSLVSKEVASDVRHERKGKEKKDEHLWQRLQRLQRRLWIWSSWTTTWRMIQSTSKWTVLLELELDTIHRMWKTDGKHSALYNATEAGNLEEVQELISLTNVTTEEKGTDSPPKAKSSSNKSSNNERSKTSDRKLEVINHARRWTEVDYKASGFTKEYEWYSTIVHH